MYIDVKVTVNQEKHYSMLKKAAENENNIFPAGHRNVLLWSFGHFMEKLDVFQNFTLLWPLARPLIALHGNSRFYSVECY